MRNFALLLVLACIALSCSFASVRAGSKSCSVYGARDAVYEDDAECVDFTFKNSTSKTCVSYKNAWPQGKLCFKDEECTTEFLASTGNVGSTFAYLGFFVCAQNKCAFRGRSIGDECTSDKQCYSGSCKESKCAGRPVGDSCTLASFMGHEVCELGLFCDSSTLPARCTKLRDVSEACSASSHCKEGLVCGKKEATGPMQCRDNSVAAGEACAESTQCYQRDGTYLRCISNKCTPKYAQGESCAADDKNCAEGTICDSESKQCVQSQNLAEGVVCDSKHSCADGLFCKAQAADSKVGVCAKLAQTTCSKDDDCGFAISGSLSCMCKNNQKSEGGVCVLKASSGFLERMLTIMKDSCFKSCRGAELLSGYHWDEKSCWASRCRSLIGSMYEQNIIANRVADPKYDIGLAPGLNAAAGLRSSAAAVAAFSALVAVVALLL